ncbi:MAG: DUF4268 domain-containing protein [Actinomycetota bacterium]
MGREGTSSDPAFLAAYGEAVVARREELGMDRKVLAERSGISYSYLSAIESGQKVPSGTYQTMLANGLELSPADLLARANGALRDRDALHDWAALSLDVRAARRPEVQHMEAFSEARSEDPGLFAYERVSRSSSGIVAELEALLPLLAPEDQDMVLGMVRRLAGTEPPPPRRPAEIGQKRYRGSAGRELRTEAYLRFWTMYLDALQHRGFDWGQGRTPEPRSYFTTPSPIKGSSLSASFARNRLLRHEMYINRGSREANIELLAELRDKRSVLENAYGASIEFEDPGRERRAVRIAEYRGGHISHADEYDEYVEWFIDRGVRMRRALDAYVAGVQG